MRLKAPQFSEPGLEVAQPDPGLSLETSRQEQTPALSQSPPPQALQDQAHSQLAPRLQGHYSADEIACISYATAQVAHQEGYKGPPEGIYASPDKERLAIKYSSGITELRIADLLQQPHANTQPQHAVQGTGPWSAHSYQNELDKQSQAWVETNGPGRVSRISLVKVQSGDTLEQLVGTRDPQTLDRTAQYNQLASRHQLAASSTIAIPDAGILQTVPVSEAVVQKGEQGASHFAQRQADATAQERQVVAEQTAPAANTIPPAGMSGATEVLTAQHKEKASNDSYASAQSSESGMLDSTKRAISDMAGSVADFFTPDGPTPQELQRGREVTQINRAFENAQRTGDVKAMQSLHERYQQVMADSDMPSMMNVPRGGEILKAQTNAQAGWDRGTLTVMALSAMPNGFSGIAAGPRLNGANSVIRLSPRVDVTDNFSLLNLKGGNRQYSYLDPDNGHGLLMNIDKNGVLGFDIRAQGDVATLGSGRDMFISGMQRLRADGVQVNSIRGYWMEGSDSVNFQQYVINLKTMSPQQAAINTWTGRIASEFGYVNASQPKTSFGNTTVFFVK